MKSHHFHSAASRLFCLSLFVTASAVFSQSPPLIVVEDRGGVSALPYYQALDLQPRDGNTPPSRIQLPPPPSRQFDEADMLTVHSARLSPGEVTRRVIQAPGLTPVFLIGDDDRSRAWLRQRAPALRNLGAVGLVVQVESPQALASLRALAPGLTLAPVSGDELAQRLGLRHYPVLVTATSIEQ
jgi:integrating conjugative element protein (TIGR03765 family)